MRAKKSDVVLFTHANARQIPFVNRLKGLGYVWCVCAKRVAFRWLSYPSRALRSSIRDVRAGALAGEERGHQPNHMAQQFP